MKNSRDKKSKKSADKGPTDTDRVFSKFFLYGGGGGGGGGFIHIVFNILGLVYCKGIKPYFHSKVQRLNEE